MDAEGAQMDEGVGGGTASDGGQFSDFDDELVWFEVVVG